MDFKIFFDIIKKNIKFILIFAVMILIIVEVISWSFSGGYDASLSLFVFSKTNQPTQDYQYDGYYSLKAADEFSNTVSQWTKSPEIVSAVYKKSEVAPPVNSLQFFYRAIKAQKLAPQYIDVKFNVLQEAQAGKIAKALIAVLQEKADLAGKYSGNVIFTITGGEPIAVKNNANYFFNGYIALVAGILLATLIVLLKENEDRN